MALRASHIGLIVGLVIGYFWLMYRWEVALAIALFGLIGWLIGKLVSGEINVDALRQIFSRR
jgi:uncharacterized membrane protein YfcA